MLILALLVALIVLPPLNEQGRILTHYLSRWNFLSTHLHLGSSVCSHTSEHNLQLLLDLTSTYARQWRYQFNASKSAILVLGESPRSRQVARSNRSWSIGSNVIPEADTYTHLGILRSVHHSDAKQVSDSCTSGRSAFYPLNAVGSRFGCFNLLQTI